MAFEAKMEKAREFFQTPAGKVTAVGICAAALLVLYLMSRNSNPAVEASAHRTYVCSETGKPFPVTLKMGMTIPVHSPFSGKDTGYPAEACYWTKEGKPKKEPFWQLLNEQVGKRGPTFCPDCGRLVRSHNPVAAEGMTPPPTEAEYKPRKGAPANVVDGQ